MIRNEEVFKIGVIGKPHGVEGEMNFNFTDDVFDRVDADYLVFKMDGIMVPFFFEEYRFRNDSTALVKMEDIDTEEDARRMTGVEVYFPYSLADADTTGERSWQYFVGFQVEDVKHGHLGTVQGVDDSTANVLLEVETPEGEELLIPAVEDLIQSIDDDKRLMMTNLPDGLVTLGSAEE